MFHVSCFMTYNPKEIEQKWQRFWEKEKIFAAKNKSDKPKYYCLIEFVV